MVGIGIVVPKVVGCFTSGIVQPGKFAFWQFNSNCPVTKVRFNYIVPSKLSGLVFQSDSSDAIIQKATCQFKFAYYDFCPDAPENLNNTL